MNAKLVKNHKVFIWEFRLKCLLYNGTVTQVNDFVTIVTAFVDYKSSLDFN